MSAFSSPINFTLRSILILAYSVFFSVFIGFNFDGFGQLFTHSTATARVDAGSSGQHQTYKEAAHHPVKKQGMRLNKRFHPESFLVSDFVLETSPVYYCQNNFSPDVEDKRLSFVRLFFCLRAPPSLA